MSARRFDIRGAEAVSLRDDAVLIHTEPRDAIERLLLFDVDRVRCGLDGRVAADHHGRAPAICCRHRTSWIAVRILPSAHTNPIFVLVDGQPIHASLRSARWCREAVDVCWEAKQGQIRAEERAAARAAYDHAASLYDQIAERSHED